MSEALLNKVEARKQQAEDAELAPQMSKQQTADHERTIAGILRPRESVLQALKRLRGSGPVRTAKRKQVKEDTGQVRVYFAWLCLVCCSLQLGLSGILTARM